MRCAISCDEEFPVAFERAFKERDYAGVAASSATASFVPVEAGCWRLVGDRLSCECDVYDHGLDWVWDSEALRD